MVLGPVVVADDGGAAHGEAPGNAATNTKSTYIITEWAATPGSPQQVHQPDVVEDAHRTEAEMLLISSEEPLVQAWSSCRP